VNPTTGTSPLVLAVVFGMLSLLPALLLVGTSFVKCSVVLGLLRNALGSSETPSSLVVLGLSAILSLHVMAPTVGAMVDRAGPQLAEALAADPLTPDGLARLGKVPWVRFLRANAHARERRLFVDLARQAARRQGATATIADDDVSVLLPAFVVTELTRAFTIAFLVFLPFLVVDLVVASLLVSLGLTGLPPPQVALPFKLLLFVAADGWLLLVRALVLGYR
jgi:type III secretion protein R